LSTTDDIRTWMPPFRPQFPTLKFLRFRQGGSAAYAILRGERVRQIRGSIFDQYEETKGLHWISRVKLLCPCEPPKIFAVGRNYRSHIKDKKPPENPEIFFKPISALQNPGDPIVIPRGAKNVHFEGELVAVIGKTAKKISPSKAKDVIFGVTCGNDVSERDWQIGSQRDLQWWRAKGADTFAPVGPLIVRDLDYSDLLLQTRVNGQVVQEQRTSDLIFDLPTIVSWISQFVTLTPGDLIFTGTLGETCKIKPSDLVEVEIEGLGVLRNPVVSEDGA